MQKQSRECLHAGDWYPSCPSKLNHEINELLARAHREHHCEKVKALIVPHGSLSSSGSTSAAAYKQLSGRDYARIFVFGPHHNSFISGCNLTYMEELQTPLGALPVDWEVVAALKEQLSFRLVDIDKDQEEHSIEVQLPFIIKMFQTAPKLIPILTGPFDEDMLSSYQRAFAGYFSDSSSLFIFTTDFCHWGERNGVDEHHPPHKAVLEKVHSIDKEGMNCLQRHNFEEFRQYVHRTKNTICGRDSLYILLRLIESSKVKLRTKFLKYTQAEQVSERCGHLISYASAVVFEQQK